MTVEQKTVAVGAASGIVAMIFSVWLLAGYVPRVAFSSTADRLAYALGANVFALVPLFIMLVVIGNERFLSKAIDPTRHAEDSNMQINGRVADNTLQQNFVFAVASLALSTVVSADYLNVIWAFAIVFVLARFCFWLGYRIHPLYRAPGMSATAYMNLGIIVFTLYKLFL